MYGQKCASKQFYCTLATCLCDNGFVQAKNEPCLFVNSAGVRVLLWVDAWWMTCWSEALGQRYIGIRYCGQRYCGKGIVDNRTNKGIVGNCRNKDI